MIFIERVPEIKNTQFAFFSLAAVFIQDRDELNKKKIFFSQFSE